MEKLNDNKIICHIVGLNPSSKEILKKFCLENKKYNLIDLDKLNNDILNEDEMNKMFTSYSKLKKNKNDKYKDVDKKMTKHWEDSLVKKVFDLIPSKKRTILIGKNHHYRIQSKKVNFLVSNKFIIDTDLKNEVKNNIKFNLRNHEEDIINGTFPLEFIDYKKELKKIKNFHDGYIKSGYKEIKLEEIIKILEFHSKNKIKGKGLWISSNEPYNIGSLIHPNNKNIIAYIDPVLSLLGSFNFEENDIEYNSSEDKVVSLKNININKMKKGRYLYFVSKENFIPYESKNVYKYFSQNPAIILEKEKIDNVYSKLKELEILN